MKSRWSHLKSSAITLRQEGRSIGEIEKILCIPRSTLSGWFKNISLSSTQRKSLLERSRMGLVQARIKAAVTHTQAKEQRIKTIEIDVADMIRRIDFTDPILLEIALAILYFGEGSKKNLHTAMGASDPAMIRFFVFCLQKLYQVPSKDIRCNLHLRFDQDSEKMKRYWANELQLPLINFGKTSFDPRTIGKPTYSDYPGVCLVNCGRVEIQRRLMYIAKGFCTQASVVHMRG